MSTLRDYKCPICMIIMIQPVTLPCTHELCLKCFNAGYQNTSALCPFCRVRISTWARYSMKSKTLVNETKWQLIQKLFPEKVEQVMSGKEFSSDDGIDQMSISYRHDLFQVIYRSLNVRVEKACSRKLIQYALYDLSCIESDRFAAV